MTCAQRYVAMVFVFGVCVLMFMLLWVFFVLLQKVRRVSNPKFNFFRK